MVVKYPRMCPFCTHVYSSKHTFSKHKINCGRLTADVVAKDHEARMIEQKIF